MTSVQQPKSVSSAPVVGPLLNPLNDLPEYTAFKSALLYSAGILILPLLAFFITKTFVFDGVFSLNVITSNVCSAVCAVLVLHVSLGAFIYKAYCGSEKTAKQD